MIADGVVLVHGSNLSASCWNSVVEHLDAPSVAVDLPGRARRPADILSVTLDDCVAAVIESVDKVGLESIVLVGHSLGGVVVTETAVRHPDRVGGLVFVGALIPAVGHSAAMVMFGQDLPEDVPQAASEERVKLFFANDMSDEQWAGVWRDFVPEAPLLWNARLSGYPKNLPVTYISLAEDVGVPPSLAEQMIANVGVDVNHCVLSAGHLAMVTKPRELANAINSAIAG